MSRTYVVTTEKNIKPPIGGVVVESLTEVEWDSIDFLVFHSSIDINYDQLRIIGENVTKEGLKVIYINENPSPILMSLFYRCNSVFYKDELYLKDSEVLDYAISDFNTYEKTDTPQEKALTTIRKSLDTLKNGSGSIREAILDNDDWFKQMNNSMTVVKESLDLNNKMPNELVSILDGVFMQLKELAVEIQESNVKASREMDELQNIIVEYKRQIDTFKKVPKRQSSLLSFAEYTVPKKDNYTYMCVKAYTPCRYLNSFILNYQNYLRHKKQLNMVVLFILPNQTITLKKFEDIGAIIRDNSIDMISYESNVYTTNEPTKKVLDAFFHRVRADIYALVDLTYNEPLIKGSNLKVLNAVGSMSDIDLFKIPVDKTFVPITQVGLHLPHILRYIESSITQRQAMYMDKMGNLYKKVDKILGV